MLKPRETYYSLVQRVVSIAPKWTSCMSAV